MPPTAPTPSAPATAAPKSDMDLMRGMMATLMEQNAELRSRLDSVAPTSRIKREPPVYAKAPWEEVIWVEALEEGYYPNPPKDGEDVEFAILRKARVEFQDERKQWQAERGGIFRLKHREHLAPWMRRLESEDEDIPAAPRKAIPMTTARGQHIKHF